MSKTKIIIYYHNDLDGIFSAILFARTYLDNNVPVSIDFKEVDYNLEKTWQDTPLSKDHDITAVVDFLYHPDATIWYDHHLSGWGKVLPHTEYKGRFDSSAPSCARVIFDDINRARIKDEALWQCLIKGVDIVDQAQYINAEQPYNLNLWFSALRLSLMHSIGDNSGFVKELINLFLHHDQCLKRLKNNVIPEIAEWRAAKVSYQLQQTYMKFKEVAKLENKVVYFTVPPFTKFDRYFSYRFYPEALYTVYIIDNAWRGTGGQVAVSKNPFLPQDPDVNIKEIVSTYGGGGHMGAGGIVTSTIEKAAEIQKEIVQQLSNSVTLYSIPI